MSQAGALLLSETLRVTGLGRGLPAGLARWRAPRAVHDPGKIIADLAAALALGGDCLADIAVLREQPDLAGPVASDPVVSRLVSTLAATRPGAEGDPRGAGSRAGAGVGAGRRRRARRGRRPGHGRHGRHIVIAHSEKEQAAPTWKKTFGLLTELPEASSQFRGAWLESCATVPAHGR